MKVKAELARSGLVVVALLASTGCGAGASGSRPRGYTRVEVARAFSAEGLPLTAPFGRDRGKPIILVPQDARLSGRVSVMVYGPRMAAGSLGIRVQAGQRVVRLKNVIISFAPRGRSASAVRAAIARLR
jgi:hypothetical protein